MATKEAKARYWVGVLYPENMRDDWQESIGDIVGKPFAYCIHDKDHLAKYKPKKDEDHMRKKHVHLVLVWGNTTTYKSAFNTFNKLSAEGKKALNKIEQVDDIRNKYNYLIHDTETCRRQHKYAYDPSERITGNNFDIGAYEQISANDKLVMKMEMAELCEKRNFTNFADLDKYVRENLDLLHYEIFSINHSYFEKLTKANYHKKFGQNV